MGHEGVKAFGALNRQYVIKVLLLLPFPFRQKKKEAREKEGEIHRNEHRNPVKMH